MGNIAIWSKIYIFFILIMASLHSTKVCAEVTWTNKSTGLAGYEFTALCADGNNPDVIYAGATGSILKTADGGNTWKNIFKVPGTGKTVNFIAVDPKNPAVIYIATASGIFKSTDGGNRWSAFSHNIREDNVFAVLIDADDSNTIFASTENAVYKSENGGANWIKSSSGISENNIRSIVQNFIEPKILFAAAEQGLFKSVDRGKTWKKVFFAYSPGNEDAASEEHEEEAGAPERSFTSAAIDPIDPSILYVATNNGIFKSEDNGYSWKRLAKTGLTSAAVYNLTASSCKNGAIFAATEKGVFRFSKEENAWREFSQGLSERKIDFIALADGQEALWIANKNGIFESAGNIYEIDEKAAVCNTSDMMQNFSGEPAFREVQEAAIRYAEVQPDKIAAWRRAAKTKALLPTLSVGVDKNSTRGIHWDSGTSPDTWVVGPDDKDTGWDITCSWDLGELIWNDDQTNIDVRSKLMVELRNDIIDEITRLYFERRRIQVELLQNPPKDPAKRADKELRLQELTANIDGMTGGYFSREIELRKR